MHDAFLVRGRESLGHIDDKYSGLLCVQLALSHEPVLEALSFHVLHLDEVPASRFVDVENLHDVGMLECGCRTCLTHEPLHCALGALSLALGEDLKRADTAQARMLCLVYCAHAAFAKFIQNPVLPDLLAHKGVGRPVRLTILARRRRGHTRHRPESALTATTPIGSGRVVVRCAIGSATVWTLQQLLWHSTVSTRSSLLSHISSSSLARSIVEATSQAVKACLGTPQYP